MDQSENHSFESLRQTWSRLDRHFEPGRNDELADIFAEDARLMWPNMDDIIGREAILSTFHGFFRDTIPLSYSPDRQIVEICGNKVFTIGRFVEEFQSKDGGPIVRIHGRLVEEWTRRADGKWEITIVLTSRYKNDELLPTNPD